MYSALGFRGTQEMKLHFREFVLKQNDRTFDDQTLLRMQYGTDNEVIYFTILYRQLHQDLSKYAIQYHQCDNSLCNSEPTTALEFSSPSCKKIKVNAVATLNKKAMPALFLLCTKFYEVGSYFINGDVIPHLMEVSPDGVIRLIRYLLLFNSIF